MAHIPMDDINSLWDSMSDKSWNGLYNELQLRKGKAEGISDTLISDMMNEVNSLRSSGQTFPDSPQKLYDMLNQSLEQEM